MSKMGQYGAMNIPSESLTLPPRDEAISSIAQFTELDPTAITTRLELASALGGMSTAVSVVAHDYGELHRLPGHNVNTGLRTVIGEGGDMHYFHVARQDMIGGATFWRSAVRGGPDTYLRHVRIPRDDTLQRIQELHSMPQESRIGWPSGEIYAKAVTTDENGRTVQEYRPFYGPAVRPADYHLTQAEEAVGYTRILQELSRTLLEVVA